MRPAPLLLRVLVAGSAACSTTVRPAEVTPVDLTTLDAERARHEGDPDALSAVGISFYRAGAYERARDVFLAVLALRPHDSHAVVELGLSYEALRQYDAALEAYRRASVMRGSKRERKAVEERIVALARVILAVEARRAIAAESALAGTPPAPNTVAVLPWSYLGSNPELKPLERGLAHLVLSDLAKVSRFTLVERERVQALADELALDAQGRIEPTTAARSGRLLRAAEVVQGSIRETSAGAIRLDANVVSASTSEIRASSAASNQLAQLFAMEKSLVFDLLGRLGVSLTPAEQRALAERPTADLQAFLSFSRGLEAEDGGRFNEAAQFFQQAVLRDPSFSAARERSARSTRIDAAARMTPARLAQLARIGPGATAGIRGAHLVAAIQGIAPTLAGRFGQRPGKLAAIRARVAEALRQDDPARIGRILETFPRP